MSIKNVKFNLEKNTIHEVHSANEYNRNQIESIMYLKLFGKITLFEWTQVLNEINMYKLIEMQVHNDSVTNTRIHKI
jgi:hypothetical protein